MYTVTPTVRRPRTLADTIGSATLLRDALLVIGFSLFVALCAQIAIPLPWTPVPITGQTLGVLLAGAILGPRRGFLALALYLAEGVAGLPVFAPSAALTTGFARLAGPTGGYLIAFPLAAALVGWLAGRGWDRKIPSALAMFVLGNIVIYAIGVSRLAFFVPGGFDTVMAAGVYPFLPGDAIKIVLAALALPGAWKLFNSERS